MIEVDRTAGRLVGWRLLFASLLVLVALTLAPASGAIAGDPDETPRQEARPDVDPDATADVDVDDDADVAAVIDCDPLLDGDCDTGLVVVDDLEVDVDANRDVDADVRTKEDLDAEAGPGRNKAPKGNQGGRRGR